MKCKSCGANYKTRELMCPYCHTENIIGKLWKAERTEAEREYERNLKETDKKISPYVVDRVLTRAIVVTVGIYILIFLGAFIVAFAHDKYIDIRNELKEDEILATMESYHHTEQYSQLHKYMSDMDVMGEKYYGYTQAALMQYDYEQYLAHRCIFLDMSTEEKLEDDYHLEYAIRYSVDVYKLNCGMYYEIDPMNEELWSDRQMEMKAFWIGSLGLSEEDIAFITGRHSSLYGDEFDAIVARVRERLGELDGE